MDIDAIRLRAAQDPRRREVVSSADLTYNKIVTADVATTLAHQALVRALGRLRGDMAQFAHIQAHLVGALEDITQASKRLEQALASLKPGDR